MAFRILAIMIVAATSLALVTGAPPVWAQSMDGGPPASAYPQETQETPPFEEATRYQAVPFRVDPARVDPQSRAWLDRFDVRLQPYRIYATSGGEISLADAHINGPRNNIIRVGTTVRLCNRGQIFEFPLSMSPAARNWANADAPHFTPRYRLGRLPPGECIQITPDQPGLVRLGCDVHAHEAWRLLVLPADHDMSEESIQLLLLRLSQGQSGEFALFSEKPTDRSGGPAVRTHCALPHRWRFDVAGMGSSIWSVDASGKASESGLGGARGTASFSGGSIRVDWTTGAYAGNFTIALDGACNGTGTLQWTRSPTGPASFPVTFTSLGEGG